MNHVELDDLIDRLDHDVNGFSFFEKNGDFWSEAWGRVKQISSSFKAVRYPTLKEKNEAWGRFQEVVETMKKDAERRRQERESRKEQRERDSMRALQQVLNEAGRAWPWPDGLVEAMKMFTGIKLAEVMFEFAEMVIDEIMGIKPKSEADRRRQELVECSRHMGEAFRLFGHLKGEMTGEGRVQAFDFLNKVKIELERAWAMFNDEQQARRAEREEEFRVKREQKEGLIDVAESLNPASHEDREKAKGLTARWKQIGFAGREYEDALWTQFRDAMNSFWDKAKELSEEKKKQWEAREAQFEKARDAKREILREIERLDATDREDFAKLKELQEEWKAAGFAGRDHDQELWNDFKEACNDFYQSRRSHTRSRLEHALEGKREHLRKLEEWIDRDEDALSDARDKRDDAWSDGFRDKMESKIEFLENRLSDNRAKLEEVEEAISDIESRLSDLK